MRLRRPVLALTALLLGAPAAPAAAGTLQVNPVLLEIGADRRTATLTVRNLEDSPVAVRAYALAWSQSDGEDIYAETSAVIVSPPIATIPAGGTQMIRVGLRGAVADPQAFRLIVEEVPEARPADGIRVALRLNLPLFAAIAAGEAAALRWSARREADGGWTLEAANPGRSYVRLDAAAAERATGLRFDDHVAFGTVLPGSSRRWTLGRAPAVRDRADFERIAGSHGRESAAAGRD